MGNIILKIKDIARIIAGLFIKVHRARNGRKQWMCENVSFAIILALHLSKQEINHNNRIPPHYRVPWLTFLENHPDQSISVRHYRSISVDVFPNIPLPEYPQL